MGPLLLEGPPFWHHFIKQDCVFLHVLASPAAALASQPAASVVYPVGLLSPWFPEGPQCLARGIRA